VSGAAGSVRVGPCGGHDSEYSRNEEQKELNDNTGDEKLNKSGYHIGVVALELDTSHSHERPPEGVPRASAVVVVTEEDCRGEVEDEDDEVEERGHHLKGMVQEEDGGH